MTDWHVQHYGTRAHGGFAVVIAEATAVTPEGRISPADLGLWSDGQIHGFARIADAIHAGGAIAGVQLGHSGRKGGTRPNLPSHAGAWKGTRDGWHLLAPSAIPSPGHATPTSLSEPEIERIIRSFTRAAHRADSAGIDLIEIHAAHGYLIHQFLSPLTNHRRDSYGGSVENRERILMRIVGDVRAAVSDSTAISVRLSATDWADGGLTASKTCRLAKKLAELDVDVIHVSTGGNVEANIPVGPGYQLPYAHEVSQAVASSKARVVGVGLITSARQAEEALAKAMCDAVAIGRPALNDPYLPIRWAHELSAEDYSPAPEQYWRGNWSHED